MADLVSQWKAFTPEQRNEALSRMTPVQKQQLATALGYKGDSQPATPPPTDDRNGFQKFADEIQTYAEHPEQRGEGQPNALNRFAGGAVESSLGVLAHPIKTAEGMFKSSFGAPEDTGILGAAEIIGGPGVRQLISTAKSFREDPARAAGDVVGGTALGEATDEVLGPITRGLKGTVERARDNIGSSPRTVSELVKKTKETNDAAVAKADEANAGRAAKRKADLKKHFEKTEAVKAENAAKEGEVSRRQAIERGIEQKDVEFQGELKETAKNVKDQADQKYAAVRAATEGKAVPSSELAGAVRAAEEKLQGSNENIKVFRDILAKHPEADPDFVQYQGAQIPKGHPLYDVLTGETPPTGATFADLQGYYSELGDKLASGALNGDVYQAMKSLHESIGGLMQEVADQSGVGPQLREAQRFYRGYMQTFRDSSSPLYKAIKASERGRAIKSLAGKDQTGIQALARYNPELAQKANTLRELQAEAVSLPKKATGIKSPPKLAEKPEPVIADAKKINTKDIEAAKQKRLTQAANHIRHWGTYLGFVWPAIEIIRTATRGEMPNIESTAASMIATPLAADAIARIIESPKMKDLLTRATPKDIAQVPEDLRGDLPQIVKAAQSRGIKVSPALAALVGAGAAIGPKTRQLQQTADEYRQTAR